MPLDNGDWCKFFTFHPILKSFNGKTCLVQQTLKVDEQYGHKYLVIFDDGVEVATFEDELTKLNAGDNQC